MTAPVSPAPLALPNSSSAVLPPLMSFCPSVEELDEVNEPRSAPPLQFSSHILQDSDEPNLPPTYDYADWPLSQNNTLPPVTREMLPANTDQIAIPLAVVVSDAHREDQGVLPFVVTPERLAPRSFVSDNAPVSGRIPEQHFYAEAIRVLDLNSDGVTSTDNKTLFEELLGVSSSKDNSLSAIPVHTANEGQGPSAVQVIESSDTDKLEELEMAAISHETIMKPFRTGTSAGQRGVIATANLKQDMSASIEPGK
ncbi:hypothetical protein B0H14DRAFT_2602338 [Mycena olivaceomarginata]|nr:hypothetical protein B0H14DRAFT_2602338 [Mycena olivaceomarginata]